MIVAFGGSGQTSVRCSTRSCRVANCLLRRALWWVLVRRVESAAFVRFGLDAGPGAPLHSAGDVEMVITVAKRDRPLLAAPLLSGGALHLSDLTE
jgi:hypothetical protein